MKNILNITDYKDWLQNLKGKIQQSQIKAAIQVNSELLRLYWQIGKDITEKQTQAKWGDSFLQTLSADLRKEFPTTKGFSERNLRYCKKFYLFYNQKDLFLHQLGAEIPTAFAFKIIGLYFINKPQKIVGNIRYFLFKKSLLRIAPSFRKVRKSGVCEGNGG